MARIVNGIANVLNIIEMTPINTAMYDMSNVISFLGNTGSAPFQHNLENVENSIAVCKRSSLVVNTKHYINELLTFLQIMAKKHYCIIVLDYIECTEQSKGDCVFMSNNEETNRVVNSVRPCAIRRTLEGDSYIDYDTISHALCSIDDIVMMALSQFGYDNVVTSDVALYDDITSKNVYISSEYFENVPLAGAYLIMGSPGLDVCRTIYIDSNGMRTDEIVGPLMELLNMFSMNESKKLRLPLSKFMPTIAKKRIKEEHNEMLKRRRPRYSRR